jgi:hypothetical protein
MKRMWIFLLLGCLGFGAVIAAPPRQDQKRRQVKVSPKQDLAQMIGQTKPNTTLLLADGLYRITRPLIMRQQNVWLRSASGNRDKVILDGLLRKPMKRDNCVNEVIAIKASGICISDISIRHARDHGLHISPAGDGHIKNIRIDNIHIYDCGQQLIKVNSNGGKPKLYWANDGIIENSLIEFQDNSIMQDMGKYFYTGGIDIHGGSNWLIRDNVFRNIQRDGKLMEHAVHMWNKCRGTIVERNQFIDCVRGIGFGMKREGGARERKYADGKGDKPYFDHIGGVIRNNMIFNRHGIRLDSGIELMNVIDVKVYHNTVVSLDKPFSCIEYRWPNTRVQVKNNIVSHSIRPRDGAKAELAKNISEAPPKLFKDYAKGDLHLARSARQAVDRGEVLGKGEVIDDVDGDKRGKRPDIGADEQ